MKVCFKCGAEKPLSEFYKHSRMADGHLNKCKDCTKKDVYENREDKRDYYLEYDRNRPNHEERVKVASNRVKILYREDEGFKQSILETKKRWAEANKHKLAAQHAANNAVRDGKLDRKLNCEHCGTSEKKLQKHHWSYLPENWLDVIWLCTKCHGKEHRRLNELGRDPDKQLEER
jgi:hypothetical protein